MLRKGKKFKVKILLFNFVQGANIQLLDLPGIIEGASQGKGRGRQVIAVARTADLVLMILDATKKDIHKVKQSFPSQHFFPTNFT